MDKKRNQNRSAAEAWKISLLIFTISVTVCQAQSNSKPDYAAYIDRYKAAAVREMKLYGIPASITLAQGILESNCGLSPLAVEANNHFGIKCHKDWTGDVFYYDDDEKQECFRKYKSVDESFRDHSLFLKNKARYAALFSLDPEDYTGWAMGLKQAGYATNPDYPNLLIRTIELNRLHIYDDTTLNPDKLMPVSEETKPSVAEYRKTEPAKTDNVTSGSGGIGEPAEKVFIRSTASGRIIYENNGVPFILVEKGDTWYSIAKEFHIYAFQVYKENDMKEGDVLKTGQILYLEPKKRQNESGTHRMQAGETMFSVSQKYAVKLKYLYKYNNLEAGNEPAPGSQVHLRKK